MRDDMQRVIITRRRRSYGPRRYKHADFARRWRRTDPQDEPMSMGRGTKGFDDHLMPLYRYLAKQVGRPWNDVWSDICRAADVRSVVGKHLRDHVRAYVQAAPSAEPWASYSWYYVDEIGILRVRVRDDRPWLQRRRPKPIDHLVADGEDAVLARLGGIWYRYQVAPYTQDLLAELPPGIGLGDLEQVMGRLVGIRRHTKRQLSRRALKAHGLRNVTASA